MQVGDHLRKAETEDVGSESPRRVTRFALWANAVSMVVLLALARILTQGDHDVDALLVVVVFL